MTSTLLLAALMIAIFPREGAAQGFLSPEAAHGLVRALDDAGLEAIAAGDPTEPGTFVAAMYVRGSQMLVVSARHPSVEALAHRIAARQYREVYLDLQGTPTPQHKFFVQDSGADGISKASPEGGGVDVLYEDGIRQTLFNGKPKDQKLTPAQYASRLTSADARYAHLLTVLIAAIQAQSRAHGDAVNRSGGTHERWEG
jgi:hypothetical protein